MMYNNLDGSDLTFEQDGRLRLVTEGHRYIVDNSNVFDSVTSVIQTCFEQFDIDYFARKKAEKTGDDPKRLADQWKCNGEMASHAGTFMHAQIEYYFNHIQEQAQEQEQKHYKDTFRYQGPYIDITETIDIDYEMQLFHKFVADTPLKPFRTEWSVFHPELRIAGTIDLLCRTGERSVAIYDWKRSEKLIDKATGKVIKHNRWGKRDIRGLGVDDTSYWHYVLQQNLYRYILEQCYGLTVDAMHLVVLHPSLDQYYVLPVKREDALIDKLVALLGRKDADKG